MVWIRPFLQAHRWRVEAGGYLVTANDTSTYREMLGPFVQLIPWSGTSSLHNSGEAIRVVRPDGTLADFVTYSDTDGWTQEADGAGASLEWKGLGWDNALPESWIGSNALGGSPGAANSSWPIDGDSDVLTRSVDAHGQGLAMQAFDGGTFLGHPNLQGAVAEPQLERIRRP